MKLCIEGDFTKLKLNGLQLVEHLARIPDYDNILEMEIDKDSGIFQSFKVDGVELLKLGQLPPASAGGLK